MLIKRTQQRPNPLHADQSREVCPGNRWSRSPHLPAPVRPCRRRSRRSEHAAGRQRPQGESSSGRSPHIGRNRSQERLHALLGWMHRDGGGAERGMDRPGAELGFPDQSRIALRQGRFGARARAQRAAASLSDEACGRAVDARLLGYGDQRDRRQAPGNPREIWAAIPSIGSARPR